MKKITIPDGDTVVMCEDIFLQNPHLFMKAALGSMMVDRLKHNEQSRLELIFGREWIRNILSKDTYTWADYQFVLKCCI